MVYPWGDERRYYTYSAYFRRIFGHRVQKVTVNAGFTCPNRDGKVGTGGCTFCNNEAFTPSYCMERGEVTWQIDQGIKFHRNRYRTSEKYLAYFQSFSNTYAPLEKLISLYDEALSHPLVAGIIVGTRPDCVDEEKLDYFAGLSKEKYVAIEYGVESTNDKTLRNINRGHDFQCAVEAIEKTSERGIHTGAHFILGLPGEDEQMLLEQTDIINRLPLTTVKFHQLQIFKGTGMEKQYLENPGLFRFWSMEEYIRFFAVILQRLRPDLVVERFASEAPPRFQAGPTWGLVRNEKLLQMLDRYLEADDLWQGQLYGI